MIFGATKGLNIWLPTFFKCSLPSLEFFGTFPLKKPGVGRRSFPFEMAPFFRVDKPDKLHLEKPQMMPNHIRFAQGLHPGTNRGRD